MTESYEVKYPKLKIVHEGRIKLLNWGDAYAPPGCCIICRVNLDQGKYFIDFGMNIEFHGAVYFCNVCVAEAMMVFGYHHESSIEWRGLVMDNFALKKENEELKTENQNLREYENVVNGLSKLFSSSNIKFPSMVDVTTGSANEVRSETTTGEPDSNLAKVTGIGTGKERKVNKSSNEQGSASILDLASIDAEISNSLGDL